MKLSNQSLGLLFAALMLGLLVTAMVYRRYGGHEPIRPVVAPARKLPTPVLPPTPPAKQ